MKIKKIPKVTKEREDLSKTNPGLHLIYVEWACKHLVVIDECMTKLWDLSNLNMMDMLDKMEERENLVKNREAYTVADRILASIKAGKWAPFERCPFNDEAD
jgi:hypothetical protein